MGSLCVRPLAEDVRGRGARKEVKIPAAGIPGAPTADPPQGRSRYSREDCIAALWGFDSELSSA